MAIEGALQDGFQTLIGIDLQQQGPLAGRFQAGRGIGFGKAENSEAGAIARFRMLLSLENRADYLGSGGTDGCGPMD